MVVRFLPVPDGEPAPARPDRENLAEVVELRARFSSSWAVPVTEPELHSETDVESSVSEVSTSVSGSLISAAALLDSGASAEQHREGVDQLEAPVVVSLAERRARTSPPSDSQGDPETGPVSKPAVSRRSRATPNKVVESDELDETPLNDIDEDVVRIMARKARSSGELQRELTALGHLEFDAEDAVARAVEALYVDDEGLARALCAKLRDGKGASRSQIRQKLRDRRLPDSVIELVIDELDEADEDVLLRETARDRARKMGSLDRVTAERRLLGFLARRGWGGEAARSAVRDALDGGAQRRGSGSRSGNVRFE